MAEGNCHHMAIVGSKDLSSTGAALQGKPSSTWCQLRLVYWLAKTCTLGCQKCSIIWDSLLQGREFTVDLHSKSTGRAPTFSIIATMTVKMLVLLMGKAGVHGGMINRKCSEIASPLRHSQYWPHLSFSATIPHWFCTPLLPIHTYMPFYFGGHYIIPLIVAKTTWGEG